MIIRGLVKRLFIGAAAAPRISAVRQTPRRIYDAPHSTATDAYSDFHVTSGQPGSKCSRLQVTANIGRFVACTISVLSNWSSLRNYRWPAASDASTLRREVKQFAEPARCLQ